MSRKVCYGATFDGLTCALACALASQNAYIHMHICYSQYYACVPMRELLNSVNIDLHHFTDL